METPLQTTFIGFSHTDGLDQLIAERAVELDSEASNHLTSCHVVVELGGSHGNEARIFHARINMTLPGGALAVNHAHRHTHQDPFIAVRDAFDAARRQVVDWKRRRYGDS